EELADFTECFITGTAAEVTPVGEIADWRFAPSGITHQLMDAYSAAVRPQQAAA
ncbi:MAG: branched-chain amino acid aminotransferase, partial [Xanthobacter sp. 17-67-6]